MEQLSIILSCWADQYSSIDTSNTNIHPLVISLWQNILKQQYVALSSLLTNVPNRKFYRKAQDGHILYWSRILKMWERRKRKTEKPITEANLIVNGSSGWVSQYDGFWNNTKKNFCQQARNLYRVLITANRYSITKSMKII